MSAAGKAVDATTRWIAGFTALCAIALSAILLGEFRSSQLPARVNLERFAPDAELLRELEATDLPSLHLDEQFPSTYPPPAILRDGTRHWFRVGITLPPEAAQEMLIASFSQGLVVPERVWLLTRSGLPDDPQVGRSQVFALPIASSAAGRWVPLPATESGKLTVIAKIVSPGVGQPKLKIFKAKDREGAALGQTVRNVAFTSILLILACFGAVVAATSRDWTFLVFSGWLLMSLRVVAINSGWGLEWAAKYVPTSVIAALSPITLSAYGLFTLAVFRGLLNDEIRGRWSRRIFTGAQASYIFLGAATMVVPSSTFYRFFWLVSAVAILAMIAKAAWITAARKSSVAFMFLLSWTLTFGGMGSEILYISGLMTSPMGMINAEMGALGGALACALALAQRLRAEIVARQLASEREMKASAALKANYESMPIGLFGCDRSGRLVIFNPAFTAIFQSVTGETPQIGESLLAHLIGSDDAANIVSAAAGELQRPTLVNVKRGDDSIWLQLRIRGTEGQIEASVEDVTLRVKAEAALARLVDHDSITKALNQRGLNDAVERALQLVESGTPCSIIEADIDRFKILNDFYGPLVGDQLLATVCNRLMPRLRADEAIARVGDSFRLIVTDRSAAEVETLAAGICREVSSTPLDVAGRVLNVTLSVGVFPLESSMTVRDAIAAGSQACAEAKRKGRNRVVQVARQDISFRSFLEELRVQADLKDTLNSERFFVEFQPIVSLRSAFETLNYEVLVRMRDENGKTIPPSRFIPAAERNGQMSLVDHWVLMTTLHWLDAHPEHVRRLNYATINLSGSSLNDARFVDNIFAIMSDFPHLASKLCFEITETVALADCDATQRFSQRIHSMDGRIALDDFGAGYTSFSYLRGIEADLIKIDGSFVFDLHTNPQNMVITRMITDLAHQLGKRCVAEWAEKPETVAALMALSVDYAQGFGIAKPSLPETFVGIQSSADMVQDERVRALLRGDGPVRDLTVSADGVFGPIMF
ncbi:MAG: EAL domain-containing protein [Burkholderiaceae bacterium]